MYGRQAFITTSSDEIDRSSTPLDITDMDFEIEIFFRVSIHSHEGLRHPITGRECF